MSACRRHYPGRSEGTDSLSTAPSSSAFPRLQLGRLLHYQFRGLLSVHSRYNLQTHQVALCDPLHRRLRRLCCLHRRSDCYRVERSSSRAGLSPAVVQCLSRRTVIALFTSASFEYNAKDGFLLRLTLGKRMSFNLFQCVILAAAAVVAIAGTDCLAQEVASVDLTKIGARRDLRSPPQRPRARMLVGNVRRTRGSGC